MFIIDRVEGEPIGLNKLNLLPVSTDGRDQPDTENNNYWMR
jgi:hypothetical protein